MTAIATWSGAKSGSHENVIIFLGVIKWKTKVTLIFTGLFTLEKPHKSPASEPTLKFVAQCNRFS